MSATHDLFQRLTSRPWRTKKVRRWRSGERYDRWYAQDGRGYRGKVAQGNWGDVAATITPGCHQHLLVATNKLRTNFKAWQIPEGALIQALPAYQLWYVAKRAITRKGRPAKIRVFIRFLPLIAICSVIWGSFMLWRTID
jgi:hypothetical protein